MRSGTHIAQFDAGRFGELGVQSKYLDRKGNLVDYALSWRLLLYPKFEVVRIIVDFVSILVMDVFAFAKRAIEHLFHDKLVFEFFLAAQQVYSNISRRVHMPFGIYRASFSAFITTGYRAKTLFSVISGQRAVFVFEFAVGLGLAAKIALKSRDWLFAHSVQLALRTVPVKENA